MCRAVLLRIPQILFALVKFPHYAEVLAHVETLIASKQRSATVQTHCDRVEWRPASCLTASAVVPAITNEASPLSILAHLVGGALVLALASPVILSSGLATDNRPRSVGASRVGGVASPRRVCSNDKPCRRNTRGRLCLSR